MRSEALASWYLRLSGFLTTANFVVHSDAGTIQLGEVDAIGVRFPHRVENEVRPMADDAVLLQAPGRVLIILAEATLGRAGPNASWTKNADVLYRVVRAIGVFPQAEAYAASSELIRVGGFDGLEASIRLLALGRSRNATLARHRPSVIQVTWDHCLRFIYDRFLSYRNEKARHPQWDNNGQLLWQQALNAGCVDKFVSDAIAQLVGG
jgi:hypothetical protein